MAFLMDLSQGVLERSSEYTRILFFLNVKTSILIIENMQISEKFKEVSAVIEQL